MSGWNVGFAGASATSAPTNIALPYEDNKCLLILSVERILLYRQRKSGWRLQDVYYPLKERAQITELKRQRTGTELNIDRPLNGFFCTLTPFLNHENFPVGFRLSPLRAVEKDAARIKPSDAYYRLVSDGISPD